MTTLLSRGRLASTPGQAILSGEGLELRPWDEDLVRQMGRWSAHGFPYHAFDLVHLRDRRRASAALASVREATVHRHYVACEDGRAVGRFSVNLDDPGGMYFWAVHVPPEHQGRHVCQRMMGVAIRAMEAEKPARDFVLTSHAFALRAHAAYFRLGFHIAETRWLFDQEIARELWKVGHDLREPIAPFTRMRNGRWEVQSFVMTRPGQRSREGLAQVVRV